MILTKFPILLHDPAAPPLKAAPILGFFRRFRSFSPSSGPAAGSCNRLHRKSKFLVVCWQLGLSKRPV